MCGFRDRDSFWSCLIVWVRSRQKANFAKPCKVKKNLFIETISRNYTQGLI